MTPCELSMSVSAAANAIACELGSPEKIAVVAASFVQLGDTLATIAAQKVLCESCNKSQNSQ